MPRSQAVKFNLTPEGFAKCDRHRMRLNFWKFHFSSVVRRKNNKGTKIVEMS